MRAILISIAAYLTSVLVFTSTLAFGEEVAVDFPKARSGALTLSVPVPRGFAPVDNKGELKFTFAKKTPEANKKLIRESDQVEVTLKDNKVIARFDVIRHTKDTIVFYVSLNMKDASSRPIPIIKSKKVTLDPMPDGRLKLYYPQAAKSETGDLLIVAPLWGSNEKPPQDWKPIDFSDIKTAMIEVDYKSGPREVLPEGKFPCELKHDSLVVLLPFERNENEDLLYSIKMRVTDDYGFEHLFEHGQTDTIDHFELSEFPLKCNYSWFVWQKGDPVTIEFSTHSYPPELPPDGEGKLTIVAPVNPSRLTRQLKYTVSNQGIAYRPRLAITYENFSPVHGQKYSFTYQVEHGNKTYRFIAKQVEFTSVTFKNILFTICLIGFLVLLYFLAKRILTPKFDFGTPRLEFPSVTDVKKIRVRYSGFFISKLEFSFINERELDSYIKISQGDSPVNFNEPYRAKTLNSPLLSLLNVSKSVLFDITCLAPVNDYNLHKLTIRFEWKTGWIKRVESSFWEVSLPVIKVSSSGIKLDEENSARGVTTQPSQTSTQPIHSVLTVEAPPPPEVVLPEGVTPEEALCSTLNDWWLTDAKSRSNLLQMLNSIGLRKVEFYELKNGDKIRSDMTYRKYEFRPSNEGSWLWYSEDNNNSAFALPVFSQRFSGEGMTVLLEMVDGIKMTSQEPIFKEIWMACKLERIEGESDLYRLKEHGYLMLKDHNI